MTKSWTKQAIYLLSISLIAILLLIVLATQQYYWARQVTNSHVHQLRTNLQSSARYLSEDVDREMARIYMQFQLDASTMRNRLWKDYAKNYEEWFNTAPHPDLIDKVYLIQVYENGQLYLAKYDPEVGRFLPSEWSNIHQKLFENFQSVAQSINISNNTITSDVPELIIDDIPALVIPLSQMSLLANNPSDQTNIDILMGSLISTAPKRACAYCAPRLSVGPVFAYTVVVIDQDYFREHFIPSLVYKYFAEQDTLNYNLSISPADQPPSKEELSSDIAIDLLNIEPDKFNLLLLDSSFQQYTQAPQSEQHTMRIIINGSQNNLQHDISRGWKLYLTHQTGSLDLAIAKMQQSDFLMSTLTVALLAISLFMILITTRRSQQLAQQKLDFVTALSHEIRTPLAIICSAGENLADGIITTPERTQAYGSRIHKEGRRLSEMVEQALEFANRHDNHSIHKQPVNINALIETVVNDCEYRIQERHNQIHLDIEPDLPLFNGDKDGLRRALRNLVDNAIKYSEKQSEIRISVFQQTNKHQKQLIITISDNGRGIPEAEQYNIFEPFYRSQSVINSDIPGTGLGLNLVKYVIHAHQGTIKLTSQINQGSTFQIQLPYTHQSG
jgi:two-component system sensor histidine kinase SenX3